mmetsp:Transcript_14992/g.36864  ORF Transcript_14992/g.36864 Transcript_14992/m.36864 type:complete len:218 (-) Transcript_14992:2331-2984(-)
MCFTDRDQFIVAFSGSLLVCNKRKLGVQCLAVWAQDLGVVEHVVHQERLWITVESDVDLSDSIMCAWFCTSSSNTRLQPRLQQSKTVASLGDLDEFFNWASRADSHKEALDEVLVGAQVEKLSNNLRCLGGRHFCHVDLDVLKKTVQVQVFRKLVDEIETIANMDERTRVRKFCTLQIFLNFFRDVDVRVSAYTFCFLELTKHTRRLDVFEVDEWIL